MTLLQYIGEWVGWKMIKVRRDVIEYVEEHGSGGSQTFLGLTDTPSSYTDQSGKGVKVNTNANGLIFYTIIDTFKALTDVPVYTGNALKVLRVKSDESGVEWVTSDAPLYGSDTQIPYMYHGNYGYSGSFTFDEPNNKLSVINIGCNSIMTDAVQATGGYYITSDNEFFQDGDIRLYIDNGFKIGHYRSEGFDHLCKLTLDGISIGYKVSEPCIDNYSILIGSCTNVNDKENIAIGYDIANNIGRNNVLIGNNIGNVGNSTVSIGYYSGQNSTGTDNIFLGYSAGKNQTTLSNLLIIDNQDRGTTANEQSKSMFYGVFGTDISSQTLRINAKTGIGKSASSAAYLSLPAGTTTVAPMKIESGSLLTTPQIGAFEFWGGRFYLTDGNPTRKMIAWNPMTASGDIIYGGASGVETRLAKGTNGQVLTLVSGLPAWQTPSTITYGSQYQIPVTNAGGTGFSYSSYFTYGFTTGQIVKSNHANIISEFYKTDGSGNTVNKIAIADSIFGNEIGLIHTLNDNNYIIATYDDNNGLFSYCNGGLVSDFFNIGSYYNINIIDEAKIYLAQNITNDVLHDLRIYNNGGAFTFEICSVADEDKGKGTWINAGYLVNFGNTYSVPFVNDSQNGFDYSDVFTITNDVLYINEGAEYIIRTVDATHPCTDNFTCWQNMSGNNLSNLIGYNAEFGRTLNNVNIPTSQGGGAFSSIAAQISFENDFNFPKLIGSNEHLANIEASIDITSKYDINQVNIGNYTNYLSNLSFDSPNGYSPTYYKFAHYTANVPTIGTNTTVQTIYGFYCDEQTGATNNWGFYSAGSTPNYFGGYTTFGSLIRLTPTGSPPSPAQEGMIYAGTDHKLYFYNGTAWKEIAFV